MKKECGYIVRKMKKDGACLFRAVGKNLDTAIGPHSLQLEHHLLHSNILHVYCVM